MFQSGENILKHILINYRWIFVLFLLPISLFYDLWLYFRNWAVFKLSSAPKKHDLKVKFIQKQIQNWNKSGKKTKICTARPGWQTICFRRPAYKKFLYQINVNLVDILEINPKKQTVKVEPLVSMGQLTATLNPLGWTIPVVPELDDLTVGGLTMGTGIESSSHIYGLFQHICVSYELILSDGSQVQCSSQENSKLFYAIPLSYGTLGILTAVEIKLIPAKKYVKITYHPILGLDNICKKIEQASSNFRHEFVEALIFDKNRAILMTGNQTDNVENYKINPIANWYKPWFFEYVKNFLNQESKYTECIPLRDYYHRHSKALFWEMNEIIPFGNNILFRIVFGWLMPPKISLLKLTQFGTIKELYDNNHVIQDMLVPIETLKMNLLKLDEHFKIYPIWICPFKLPNNPGMVHPYRNYNNNVTPIYVDMGIYGVPKAKNYSPKESLRKIEKFVISVHGFQMLYADTYLTKEEFRRMFDHSLYDKLRKELNCEEAFPEVYDKVNRSVRE